MEAQKNLNINFYQKLSPESDSISPQASSPSSPLLSPSIESPHQPTFETSPQSPLSSTSNFYSCSFSIPSTWQ